MTKYHLPMALAAASLAACAILAAGSVQAEDGVLRVRLDGLDLSQPADLAVARHRVDLAIRDYCELPTGYPMAGVRQRCKHDLQRRTANELAVMQAAAAKDSRVASR